MKERLTGAIILVVLIVLLVPELLSGPSRSAPASRATTASTAPASSEEPPLRSYTIDLADESHNATPSAGTSGTPPQASGPAQPSTIVEHPAQDPAPAQQPSTGSATPEPSPQAPRPQQQTAQTPSSPALPPQEPAQPARPAPSVVQHPTGAQRPSPAQHYAAAEKRPAERPAVPEKSGGWTVQVGVFAKQANAERLMRELQEQGFRTSVSQNTSNGRTLWWVRTAPVAERAAADQLSARLRAAGHVGSVVPK